MSENPSFVQYLLELRRAVGLFRQDADRPKSRLSMPVTVIEVKVKEKTAVLYLYYKQRHHVLMDN